MIKKKIALLFVSTLIFVCASCFAACGHVCSFSEWQTEKAATCIEKGYRVRTCTHPDCGKQEREEIDINLQAHALASVDAIDAGCTTDGNVAYNHCSLCDKDFDEDGNELTAEDKIVHAAHKTVDIEEVAATEHNSGTRAYKHCTACQKDLDNDGNELTAQDLVVSATHADYDKGTLYCGTCAEYIITNVEQFKLFRDTVNGGEKFTNQTVALDADLDLDNEEWTPINGFYGTFDGRNYVIKNLKISSGDNVGLFGKQWQIKAAISNFTIDGADITGGSCVAVVLGQTASTQVTGITVKNARISAAHYAGGIVGYAYTKISDCNVDGLEIVCVPDGTEGAYDNGDKVGGIVGYLCSGGVENCSVANIALKGYRDIGGIAGTATAAEGAVYVRNNTVTNANICADQITNHYGNKDANAAEVVGRVIGAVEIETNAHSEVTIELKLVIRNYKIIAYVVQK